MLMKKTLLISIMFVFSACSTNAQITFQKTIRMGLYASGRSVFQTNDDGYIIAGDCYTYGPVFLIKTDINGTVIWNKSYYGSGENREHLTSVLQDNDGGYILAGSTSLFNEEMPDAFLIKTDEIGNLIWSKTYGGDSADYINSAQKTNDGGVIMAGLTYSFGAGLSDVYLIKTDSDGNLLWSKTYGGTNHENAESVQQTTDGGT
jgi:hypothetical protein